MKKNKGFVLISILMVLLCLSLLVAFGLESSAIQKNMAHNFYQILQKDK